MSLKSQSLDFWRDYLGQSGRAWFNQLKSKAQELELRLPEGEEIPSVECSFHSCPSVQCAPLMDAL